MSHARTVLVRTVLVLLCLHPAVARAELIQWSYSWSRSPAEVHSTNHNGAGYVALTNGGATTVSSDSYLVATNMQAYSTASPDAPDVFTHAQYQLTLNLTDSDSKNSGALTFTGEFNGTLSATSSQLDNTFLGETTQQIVLGDHVFAVTIGPYAAPGPPNSINSGAIAARAEVTVSTIFNQPEPGSLVLATLGAVGLGLMGHRRIRGRVRV